MEGLPPSEWGLCPVPGALSVSPLTGRAGSRVAAPNLSGEQVAESLIPAKGILRYFLPNSPNQGSVTTFLDAPILPRLFYSALSMTHTPEGLGSFVHFWV